MREVLIDRQHDRSSRWSVLNRIADEIINDAAKQGAVGHAQERFWAPITNLGCLEFRMSMSN